tara:strand:- start:290 stop:559 length:270 start_codon:yes stop_codon:yes gene_type:complete
MGDMKGYYSTFSITYCDRDENPVIHGGSYAIKAENIDFLTWKKNHETGEYWAKFHTMSGKEIRLRINYEELNDILQLVMNENVNFGEEK